VKYIQAVHADAEYRKRAKEFVESQQREPQRIYDRYNQESPHWAYRDRVVEVEFNGTGRPMNLRIQCRFRVARIKAPSPWLFTPGWALDAFFICLIGLSRRCGRRSISATSTLVAIPELHRSPSKLSVLKRAWSTATIAERDTFPR
jgi:hypothetical protein